VNHKKAGMTSLFDGWSNGRVATRLLTLGWTPIPLVAATKQPAVYHAPAPRSDGTFGPPRWTHAIATTFTGWNNPGRGLGLLTLPNATTGKVPFVIDCDTAAVYEKLNKAFPEAFAQAGLQKTRKGFHVLFTRTEYCDERDVFDNFKLYNGNDHVGDVKTVTKSKRVVTLPDGSTFEYSTPGNLAVFPSADKLWLRLPDELPEVPDKLVDALFHMQGTKKRSRGGPPKARAAADVVELPELVLHSRGPWRPTPARDAGCLRAMGLTPDGAVREYVRTYDLPHVTKYTLGCYQFRAKTASCPICAKAGGHKSNHYFVLYGADAPATRWVMNMSDKCARGGRVIEWTAEGRRAWQEALDGTPWANLVGEPDPAGPTSLPLEVHVYAPALRAVNQAWRLDKAFAPATPGR